MRVLLTGASGFIGGHAARTFAQRGHQVRCLVRATSSRARLNLPEIEFAVGDVTRPETLDAALAGCDQVVHMAGRLVAFSMAELLATNELGTRNILEACARQSTPPVVVAVSSLAAAGPSSNPDQPLTELAPPRPVSNYGRSKLALELVAREFADRVPLTIVRPPIVFGEADPATAVMFRPVAWFGIHTMPGYTLRRFSLIHAADLATMLVAACERGERLPAVPAGGAELGVATTIPLPFREGIGEGSRSSHHDVSRHESLAAGSLTQPASERNTDPGQGIYYVGADESPTYADLGRMIRRAAGGRRTLVLPLPETVCWTMAGATELWSRLIRKPGFFNLDKIREATAGSWICSPAKARAQLGFRTAASLDERLAQALAWYRANGYSPPWK